jgi:hypothetical protein
MLVSWIPFSGQRFVIKSMDFVRMFRNILTIVRQIVGRKIIDARSDVRINVH